MSPGVARPTDPGGAVDSRGDVSSESTRSRRLEDQPLCLIVQGPRMQGAAGIEPGEYELDVRTGALGVPVRRSHAGSTDRRLFLMDDDDDELVLIAGTELDRIPRAGVGPGLRDRLTARAAVWERGVRQEACRVTALERFVLLAEQMIRAGSPDEVFDAASEHAPSIVGGSSALVFRRSTADGDDVTWRVAHSPIPIPGGAGTLVADRLLSSAPGLVSVDDALTAAPLFEATGAAALAYAGIGPSEILVILERRADRVFHAEDWYHLRLIAREMEVALDRVRAA